MTKSKRPALSTLPDLALGSWEAACIAGVHYTRVKRMAHTGHLIYRPLESAWATDPESPKGECAYYSLRDCDQNYCDYMQALIESGGKTRYRPRSDEWLSKHDDMMRRLAAVDPITYDDAVSPAQASAILGVHVTWVTLLAREGKLRARVAMNDRRSGGRLYILSRRSCEEHRAKVLSAEHAGTKPGLARLPPAVKVKPARKRSRR